MSFNKRYINEGNLRDAHKEGYEHLVKFVISSDALIIEDDFARKVVNLIEEGDSEYKIKTLIKT